MAGKSRGLPYDTVKEHTLQQLQKSLRNGKYIVSTVRCRKDNGITEPKPKIIMAEKKELIHIEKNEGANHFFFC